MGNCLARWQKEPLSPSPSLSSLLILIEKEKERLGKQERRRRRRKGEGEGGWGGGAPAQAKGSTDIHGNLQIHSAAIISINAERQWRGEGRGHEGVREFDLGGGVTWMEWMGERGRCLGKGPGGRRKG